MWRCANRVEHESRVCKNSLTITNDEIQMKIAERLLLYQFDEEACRKYLKEITIGADVVVTVGPFNENDLLKLREYQMSRAAIKGSWSGLDFMKFSEAENPMNQPYDEAYISVFRFDNTPYFVEHNEFLTADEIGQMIETVVGALSKMEIENIENEV